MGRARYSKVGRVAASAFLINALFDRNSRDGDTGASFPRSDAEDMSKGARFIPGEVTDARRAGQKVEFVTECGPNCWYWKMPDGSRRYHFDPEEQHAIGVANGRKEVTGAFGTHFADAGPCPRCGNPNTNGGMIAPSVK